MKRKFVMLLLALSMLTLPVSAVCEEAAIPVQQETPAPEPPQTEAPPPPETQAPPPPETQAPPPPETQAPQPETAPETSLPVQETSAPVQETASAAQKAEGQGQTQVEQETSVPAETLPQTEASTEVTDQTEDVKEKESEKKEEKKEKKEVSKNDAPPMDEQEQAYSPYSSNADLIAHQHIVDPKDKISSYFGDYRFEHVSGVPASANSLTYIRDDRSSKAEKIAKMKKGTGCFILEEYDDGWAYVESGNARGFAKLSKLSKDEAGEGTAEELIDRLSNKVLTYVRKTTKPVVTSKRYGIVETGKSVYECTSEYARRTGTAEEDSLVYILETTDDGWAFVESGRVRGFVKLDNIKHGSEANAVVMEKGESSIPMLTNLIEPENNACCYYSFASVDTVDKGAMKRKEVVDFALQFIGNPYVWGGTSLTNGADCSGFVQSVYANFGYYIPRVACDQAGYGQQIPVEAAKPGDLIFYAKSGYVYHVSMYIGNGETVQAYGRNYGIIRTGIGGNAVWAVSLPDSMLS